MSSLPTPPMEDSHSSKKSSSSSKHKSSSAHRTAKRASTVYEHGVLADGRHKRVWKACERCRMKKTKCDGESPCKRCKDDGLVCTAGSRKKTEFKQLPRGYAEVLENTQYALIATVQKLYTMLRNHESWELGEPEMNDRGQPVIHDIASRLGCIRPSPDLPFAFPEGAEDFAELESQLQAARSEMGMEDRSRKHSEDSIYSSPVLARTERASSSESEHSTLSRECESTAHSSRQAAKPSLHNLQTTKTSSSSKLSRPSLSNTDSGYCKPTTFDTASASLPSPIYTDFATDSPMFRNASPFSPWSGTDDFLGPPHALDLTASYMRAQQLHSMAPRSNPQQSQQQGLLASQQQQRDLLKTMQLHDNLNLADGTIRPHMLDCNTGFDLSADQMDSILFTGDYDAQMALA